MGIVDSGSTKSDFIFVKSNGEEVLRTRSIGFNPMFISSEEITQVLAENEALTRISDQVNQIYFFGAGCRSEEVNQVIVDGFKPVFDKANVQVDSDLVAACYAAYDGVPTVVGILGTGSNSCFFDGEKVTKTTPSIGFILGDEGAGNHIGKSVIKAFYTQKYPRELASKFEKKYTLSVHELLDNVHSKPNPNTYLAKFSEFAFENLDHQFMQNLVKDCFREYFVFQVEPYADMGSKEISFVGSIAYHYQDLLREVAKEFDFKVNKFVQKPIEGLVNYYTKK